MTKTHNFFNIVKDFDQDSDKPSANWWWCQILLTKTSDE